MYSEKKSKNKHLILIKKMENFKFEDFYRVNKNAIKQYKGDLQFFFNCILI